MCIRKSDSIVFPLIVILVLVAVAARAVDRREQSARTSLFDQIAQVGSALRPEPPIAPLAEPYAPEGELVYVDLSERVNKKLSDGTIVINRNTLDDLPTGEQEFAGVRFQIIDGVMQLSSKRRERFPREIKDIPVEDTFSRLYFFHATQGSHDLDDGTLIGKYVVHYEDGTEATIPVKVGEDVRDWWNVDRSRKLERGRVGWVGTNPGVRSHGYSLRMFVSQWQNPRPATQVASIDYISQHISEAGPFCAAITIERGEAAEAEEDVAISTLDD